VTTCRKCGEEIYEDGPVWRHRSDDQVIRIDWVEDEVDGDRRPTGFHRAEPKVDA